MSDLQTISKREIEALKQAIIDLENDRIKLIDRTARLTAALKKALRECDEARVSAEALRNAVQRIPLPWEAAEDKDPADNKAMSPAHLPQATTGNPILPPPTTACLVRLRGENHLRIATFRGVGMGWGDTDWAGDSGISTDSWMHADVEWWVPVKSLGVRTSDQVVTDIFINQA